MTQRNVFTKQKQAYRQREQMWLPRGKKGRGRWLGFWGLANAN